MRLIIDTRGNNGGAGFNRYKGEGIFMPLGRKHTGLKKVKDDMVKDKIADAGHLKEKFVGKGINASTNSMENVDAVDSPNTNESSNLDSDEQSFMETISNSSKETVADEDKETVTDDEEKPAHNGEENMLDNEELKGKSDEETQAVSRKRRYSPYVIDFLINNNTDDSPISASTKPQSSDSSMRDWDEENEELAKSDTDDSNTQLSKSLREKKDHSLIKIPPTKRKRYPQKMCVHCRKQYGVRNDTRHICTVCDVALCKEPCFAEYH